MKEKIVPSGGNVFADLGFPPEEAAVLSMRADLMAQLRLAVEKRNWTQVEAAQVLGISQSRVSDLMRGKWDKFSLDTGLSTCCAQGRTAARAIAPQSW